MKITWLGQAGLLFETDSLTIMIDPYLSDSCEKSNKLLKRRMPVEKSFLEIVPDVLILTHHHLDHTDPETLPHYLNRGKEICVISSRAAHEYVRSYGGGHNCIIFEPGIEWSIGKVRLRAVKAVHSEETAFGVIVEYEGKKYYVTGDTLYSTSILKKLPEDIYAVFLPINGKGNNMNVVDASRFAADCGAMWAVPMHWGMFDEVNPELFEHPGRIIPSVYDPICMTKEEDVSKAP